MWIFGTNISRATYFNTSSHPRRDLVTCPVCSPRGHGQSSWDKLFILRFSSDQWEWEGDEGVSIFPHTNNDGDATACTLYAGWVKDGFIILAYTCHFFHISLTPPPPPPLGRHNLIHSLKKFYLRPRRRWMALCVVMHNYYNSKAQNNIIINKLTFLKHIFGRLWVPRPQTSRRLTSPPSSRTRHLDGCDSFRGMYC